MVAGAGTAARAGLGAAVAGAGTAARAGLGAAHVAFAHCEDAIGLGTRVPDNNVFHIIEREGVSSIDVDKKFLVSLLVARCVR